MATDAPALRRAARGHAVRDTVPWYAARRDREPAVIVGSRGRTNEQSVTTTYDSQFLSSTNIRDQVRSRTVNVQRRSATY